MDSLPAPIKMEPLVCPLGKMLVWDSVHRVHANTINTFGTTRVSIDFRLLPKKWYQTSNRYDADSGRPMCPGGFWTST